MLIEIRRFSQFGEQQFRELLLQPTVEAIASFSPNLFDAVYSESFLTNIELPDLPSNRLALAKALFEAQSESKRLVPRDRRVWNWIAAFYFCAFMKESSDREKAGDTKRWLVSESARYEYRHLILGPFLAYSAHHMNPESAMCMLAQPVLTPGEVVEQIQSTPEIAYSICASVATKLYYDSVDGTIKKGAGGKGPGSARRLTASYLNQIRVNLDIRGMSQESLLSILPSEFDRFKLVGQKVGKESASGSKQTSFSLLRSQLGLK
jgi:hypothetical protein